jgi:hypothetical protein
VIALAQVFHLVHKSAPSLFYLSFDTVHWVTHLSAWSPDVLPASRNKPNVAFLIHGDDSFEFQRSHLDDFRIRNSFL